MLRCTNSLWCAQGFHFYLFCAAFFKKKKWRKKSGIRKIPLHKGMNECTYETKLNIILAFANYLPVLFCNYQQIPTGKAAVSVASNLCWASGISTSWWILFLVSLEFWWNPSKNHLLEEKSWKPRFHFFFFFFLSPRAFSGLQGRPYIRRKQNIFIFWQNKR